MRGYPDSIILDQSPRRRGLRGRKSEIFWDVFGCGGTPLRRANGSEPP